MPIDPSTRFSSWDGQTCLNCAELPAVHGKLFCFKCLEGIDDRKPDRSKSISIAYPASTKTLIIRDMQEGDTGFTEPYAVFEMSGKLYVVSSAGVEDQKDLYKTVRITKRNGIYEVDLNTIDPDEIWCGWPGIEDEPISYLPAVLKKGD